MIRSFVFNQGKLVSQDVGMDVLRLLLYDEGVQIWADAEKPTNAESKELLEDVFNFHPLAIEDCLAVSERPKIDEYEQYLFMVAHAADFSQEAHRFQTTELNLFIGRNFLVTVHDDPLKSVNATVDRVLKNAPAIARAPDRLTYHLLDALLDNYEPALLELSGELGELEKKALMQTSVDILADVLQLKAEVQHLRQIITPQREVLSRLARGEFKIVRSNLLPYYRDLLDHLSRISDRTDTYRDSLTNALQVNLNLQQMEINRVIKVLTVLATLSMPLLIVTSWYGMNVRHMPNTEGPAWWLSYLIILGGTALWTALLFLFLKRRGWS
ncbi:MAG: magnesium/cobalt transporter CorA [Verrucomicrobia bacterium]|nr:magnesium/cobalt transporter CorA [Verrucomicrobiota bacterium]MBU1909479.1 magnesium/cobalt transporter CorA [Verrucomicrobiota bacterium]